MADEVHDGRYSRRAFIKRVIVSRGAAARDAATADRVATLESAAAKALNFNQ